jgi:hypothetical protein
VGGTVARNLLQRAYRGRPLHQSAIGGDGPSPADADPLFMAGVLFYLFFATAIGVFLGTVAGSILQLGLLLS